MAGEWIEHVLADACSSIDYGLTASASDQDVGPRFLRITDIVSGHIDWSAVPHVVADIETAEKYQLHHGDVVLARTGASTGVSAYVRNPPAAVFASYLVRLKAKPEFDSRFLAYYLKSNQFWAFIRGVLGDKSAQPNASASTMTKAPLRAPRDKNEQRAIAHILGTLDDKIELNRRMSETLEAMARALFKSWFVDFDPVYEKMERQDAKARGREEGQEDTFASSRPGVFALSSEVADLFPDRLVDSELGEIPEGWEVGSFASTVEIIGGGTPKTSISEYWNGDIPWFSVVDAPNESDVFVIDTSKKVTQLGIDNSSTRVLPVGAVIISARGTVGKVALVGVPMAMNQSCYGLIGKLGQTGAFIYFATKGLVTILKQNAHGSVFDTITRNTLEQTRIGIPTRHVIVEFEKLIDPLMTKIRINLFQNQSLAALRDTLLPKLISGELRIDDPDYILRSTF